MLHSLRYRYSLTFNSGFSKTSVLSTFSMSPGLSLEEVLASLKAMKFSMLVDEWIKKEMRE